MAQESGAQARLVAALRDLRAKAGLVDNARIVRYGQHQSPPVDFKPQTLSDWFTGRSVPSNKRNFKVMIDYLQGQARRKSGRAPTEWQWWEQLRLAARDERKAGGRPPVVVEAAQSAPAPAAGSAGTPQPPAPPGPVPEAAAPGTEPGGANGEHSRMPEPGLVPPGAAGEHTVSAPPPWPACQSGAPHCQGRRIEPYQGCLPHLPTDEREAYLSTLRPGSDIDLRGTVLTSDVLTDVLRRTRRPSGPAMHETPVAELVDVPPAELGRTQWDSARFAGEADFARVAFTGPCSFHGVTFVGEADFAESSFREDADFSGSTFADDAWFNRTAWNSVSTFDGVTFSGTTSFDSALFHRSARFTGVSFSAAVHFDRTAFAHDTGFDGAAFGDTAHFTGALVGGHAHFTGSVFSQHADFEQARFRADADFGRVAFAATRLLGPLTCEGTLNLTETHFTEPAKVMASATRMTCRRTRFESTAALLLRHAALVVEDVALDWPLEITGSPTPLIARDGSPVADPSGDDAFVRLLSLAGTDAARLRLKDLDLSQCRFNGASQLEQIHLVGECRFATTPPGIRWRRGLPIKFLPRRALAEEHHWHAARGHSGWTPAPPGVEVLVPQQLVSLYQALRTAAVNHHRPEAADFAYAEDDFRRHDLSRPRSERLLLTAYWLLTGYSLRASRVLSFLAVSMTAGLLVLMLWGLPKGPIEPHLQGTLTGQDIAVTLSTPRPVPPDQPLDQRITSVRLEQALSVLLNAAQLRSSPVSLTAAGRYTELSYRIIAPGLLILAALSFRRRSRMQGWPR